MKASKILLSIAAFCTIAIFSCRKDHNSNNSNNTTGTSTPKYLKRWNILDSGSQRPAFIASAKKSNFLHSGNTINKLSAKPVASGDLAIEFLLGSYVIFFDDGTVQAGQYTATNDTTLVLDSVGTIHITSITSSAFSFTLTPLNGSAPVSFTATVASTSGDFTSPADVAFVSTTWKLDSARFYLPITDSSDYYIDSTVVATYVEFSEYGTYLTRFVHANGEQDYQTNTWLWSNTNNSEFCYGNWDGQNVTNCDGLESANIVSYPSPYTKLVVEQTDPTDPLCYYLSKN